MLYRQISIPGMARFCMKYIGVEALLQQCRLNYLNKIETDFYEDDFITSVESLEEAQRMILNATELLKTTGFVLTKLSSISKNLWKT